MKKILISLLFSLSIFTLAPQSQAGEIGIVDSTKLANEYSRAQDIAKKADESREKLTKLATDLGKELKDFNAVSTVKEADKMQKEKEIKAKFTNEQKKIDDELTKMRDEVYNEIKQAINDEAKAQNLSFVTPSNIALFGGKDITSDVLKRLSSYKKK